MQQLSPQLKPLENQLYWTRGASVAPWVVDTPSGPLPVQRPPVGRRGPWVVGGVSYPSWAAAWRSLATGRPSRPSRYFGRAAAAQKQQQTPVWEVLEAVQLVPQLGIDLHKRGHEVRKLMYAGFGLRIARSGYDPEEVLQEVYRGILVRNEGKCPFDVRKSSFGHYVHMVIECVLNNYHRKEQRKRHHEVPTDTMRPEVRMGAQGDGLGMMERVVRQNVTDVDVLGVWEAMKGGRYGWREAGVDKKVWLKGVAVLQRIFAR